MRYIFLFISLISICGCSYIYDYTYKIINNSNFVITVEVQGDKEKTINTIFSNESLTILVCNHGTEGPGGPFFSSVRLDIKSIVITNQLNQTTLQDFNTDEYWFYESGTYTAIINTTDF